MPIVSMPDGAQVSFPDEMPPDQIRSLILRKFPDAGGRQNAPQTPPDVIPAQGGQPARLTVRPPFEERFGEMKPPAIGQSALQGGLEQRAAEMTRGTPTSPAANMAIGHMNVLSAAEQGVTPDVSQHQPNLISTRTTVDEAGNLLYQDPQTGQFQPTDASKHVAMRDPADNTVKVYARNAATGEGPVEGVSRVLMQGFATGAPTKRPGLPARPTGDIRASEMFSLAKPFYRAASSEA